MISGQLRLPITLALLVSIASNNSLANETISIPAAVPYAKTTSVSPAVKNECQLGEKVSAYVEQFSKIAKPQETLGKEKRIEMEITEVMAPGGGSWSGPKWFEVSGTMKEGDTDIASFRAKRFSTGGVFGGVKGTCGILAKCAKSIGKDIATWIKDPVDGAELGDAK